MKNLVFHMFLVSIPLFVVSCKKDEKAFKGGTAQGAAVIETIELGINFEDTLNLDPEDPVMEKRPDFDDAVMCFKGIFSYTDETREVVSVKDQTVVANLFSDSGCTNIIYVEITRADGSEDFKAEYNSKTAKTANLTFKKGDKLEVYMQPNSGRESLQCSPSQRRSMKEKANVEMAPNKCNAKVQ